MTIIAALISRNTTVLAEYSPPGTNFPSIARRLCAQIPSSPDSKNSYNYEGYNFNYLVEGGITYICMTDQDMKLRVPYAFLFDINNRFKSTYREKVSTAGEMAMNDTFSRVLRDRIEFFSNDRNADKITKVKGDIEDAKAVMVNNIDKVLERGERIEMLVSKTEDLHQHSRSFKKKSTQLKKKMWWQNARLCCVLIVIVLLLVSVAALIIMWKAHVFSKLNHGNHILPGPDNSTSTTSKVETTGVFTTGILTTAALTTQALTTSNPTTASPIITTGSITTGTTGTIETTGSTTDSSTTAGLTTDSGTTAGTTGSNSTGTTAAVTGTTGDATTGNSNTGLTTGGPSTGTTADNTGNTTDGTSGITDATSGSPSTGSNTSEGTTGTTGSDSTGSLTAGFNTTVSTTKIELMA